MIGFLTVGTDSLGEELPYYFPFKKERFLEILKKTSKILPELLPKKTFQCYVMNIDGNCSL
jgi:hypothetical protein